MYVCIYVFIIISEIIISNNNNNINFKNNIHNNLVNVFSKKILVNFFILHGFYRFFACTVVCET